MAKIGNFFKKIGKGILGIGKSVLSGIPIIGGIFGGGGGESGPIRIQLPQFQPPPPPRVVFRDRPRLPQPPPAPPPIQPQPALSKFLPWIAAAAVVVVMWSFLRR